MSVVPRRDPVWTVYRAVTALLEFGALPFLRWRLRRGKEDPARLSERLGQTALTRPAGALVWLHGASVGEALSLVPLIERLVRLGFHVVLTTGTVSSSRVLAGRLPPGAVHQFVPLDGPRATRRFFDRWRPDLVIFAESDLWPNLLGEAKRRTIPIALVNARMSTRSFGRWNRLPTQARSLLDRFDLILAQTEADAIRYARLSGRAVESTGTLKFDSVPPPADPVELAALKAAIGSRPVWIASSTHVGEDGECCAVHARLKGELPNLLTIVVPRRIDRGPALLAELARLGLAGSLRSHATPIGPSVEVYIADTMGDLGLFYRLNTVVFVGKSLVTEGGGGQNPIEPAKLGNAVLHGPDVANFAEVYDILDRSAGAVMVKDTAALARSVAALLTDPDKLAVMARRAASAMEGCGGATDRTLLKLAPLLPALSDRAA